MSASFEDNRQCEEWALLHGDCPVGGVKVTGYVTPAATQGAIMGGTYTATGNSGPADQQGACTFKDGAQCYAWDYYNGKCDAVHCDRCTGRDCCGRHDRDGRQSRPQCRSRTQWPQWTPRTSGRTSTN